MKREHPGGFIRGAPENPIPGGLMKKYLMNLKMSKKLLLSPLCVMVFLIIFGIVSYVGNVNQRSAINDIFNNRFKGYQASAGISNDLANVHTNVYKVISWANAQYEAERINNLGKIQLEVIDKTSAGIGAIVASRGVTAEQKKLYQEALNQLKEYRKAVHGVIDLSSNDISSATMFMGTSHCCPR